MAECQLTDEGSWRNHTLYSCEPCNIAVLDEDAARRRCLLRTPVPTAVTSDGLLGPDGDPAVIEPTPVGGGYYELPNGERVQGIEAARAAMGEPTSHDQAG